MVAADKDEWATYGEGYDLTKSLRCVGAENPALRYFAFAK